MKARPLAGSMTGTALLRRRRARLLLLALLSLLLLVAAECEEDDAQLAMDFAEVWMQANGLKDEKGNYTSTAIGRGVEETARQANVPDGLSAALGGVAEVAAGVLEGDDRPPRPTPDDATKAAIATAITISQIQANDQKVAEALSGQADADRCEPCGSRSPATHFLIGRSSPHVGIT